MKRMACVMMAASIMAACSKDTAKKSDSISFTVNGVKKEYTVFTPGTDSNGSMVSIVVGDSIKGEITMMLTSNKTATYTQSTPCIFIYDTDSTMYSALLSTKSTYSIAVTKNIVENKGLGKVELEGTMSGTLFAFDDKDSVKITDGRFYWSNTN